MLILIYAVGIRGLNLISNSHCEAGLKTQNLINHFYFGVRNLFTSAG